MTSNCHEYVEVYDTLFHCNKKQGHTDPSNSVNDRMHRDQITGQVHGGFSVDVDIEWDTTAG